MTEAEALFMEALRGGALVPELFTYSFADVETSEDLPHNNPVIVAQGDQEVNRRWTELRKERPGAGPSDYLWRHYHLAIQASEPMSFGRGYLLFRQAELATADLQFEAAARILLDGIYQAACGDAVRMDFYADPPVHTLKDFATEGGVFIAPAWLRLVAEIREHLPWDDDTWCRVFDEVAGRWSTDWRAQETRWIWGEIAKSG